MRSGERLRAYWNFCNDLRLDCGRHEITLLAAAMAHFALLSLVPLLLLASSVMGMVLHGNEHAQQWVRAALESFIPHPDSITAIFDHLVRGRGRVGGFGLLLLLWLSARMFTAMQRALDTIMHIKPNERRRPFYQQYIVSFVTVGSLGLFAYMSLILTSVVNQLPFAWPQQFEWLVRHGLPSFVSVAGFVVSAGLSVLLMFMVLRLLPSARIRTRSAVVGAVWSGALWELAKHGFAWYISRNASMDRLYGAMGGIVSVIVWSYLSALIVLLGAEVVECHARWIAVTSVTEEAGAAEEPGESHE